MNTESILKCFRQFKILAQIKYFAKAIAHAKAIDFARWPIFNISVSFLNGFLVSNVNTESILTKAI